MNRKTCFPPLLSPAIRAALFLLVLPAVLATAAWGAADRPFLHPLFSDNMVLQREHRNPVWGWTTPGTVVTVTLDGRISRATADTSGKWMARLQRGPAGGPYDLKVEGTGSVTLTNVLIGDVWICSGQSNMEMGISAVNNAEAEIAQANYERIRLFRVPKHIATKPQDLVDSQWKLCTSENIVEGDYAGFTAAGYFFGRDLHLEFGVPIGLIDTTWGGTVAEAWTSAEALVAMDDFKVALDQFGEMVEALEQGELDWPQLMAKWYTQNDKGSVDDAWVSPADGVGGWVSMDLPQLWENAGLDAFDGVVWFSRTVDLPPGWTGLEATLSLGPIDDRDTTWVNGVRVGGLDVYNRPRNYTVPQGLLKAGPNVITVRVLDTGGGGGFAGQPGQMRLQAPDGSDVATVSLDGAWVYQKSIALADATPVPQQMGNNPNVVTVLYNGMIAPLLPFGIKGAIWYQGESNASRAEQYRTLLPTMIGDWRSRFGVGTFPFFIVQLANFMAVDPQPVESDWAELREAQQLTALKDPKTGLAVAIDIGEADDIHPRNKQEVGRRLALAARAIAYGQKLPYSGPSYRSMKREGNQIHLRFDHVGGGLVAQGDQGLKGFAIAGEDGKFVWGDAVIEGDTVVVSSPAIKEPTAVRYGWANNPVATLYNRAGLPASPFRTDAPSE